MLPVRPQPVPDRAIVSAGCAMTRTVVMIPPAVRSP